ncbi:N(5)-hydroxyornithine transformylase PvdF [Burkholderia stagnalis]|uniref:formyltransferase family protein n=1 Tax=Burkholderia stagnalis TaxID=1503054 RepID=UPI0007557BC8|nr:formyltransferase family protein [Burkholderia stagnalis]KVC58643.1 N(5)-hydroxyornithine transformylase PvdF [Burkholderia stagnalis]KVN15463.1 N(5)-hydroxyornithine transformylase PvdF [Burkholderia stagnalis]KWH29888.1 N(5)-hydroxyornithine transformylase PvdF [Burkholderia stagnalis]KWH42148.1 N(5)-hydroxyornithine transformylase PvdF [Burkholderia stagnalis]KWI74064.1 N(5)-hydroxyornithine transformylase PvdF [Burkholderia stagnalis]
MPKKNLVYILSLRNGAADRAGQPVAYKGGTRYMKAPLEFLVERLNGSALGERYTLAGVIFDDDDGSPADRAKVADYGFARTPGRPWLLPEGLTVDGRPVDELFCAIPSTYRRLPRDARERAAGKQAFERRLLERLLELNADVVVLDGLLVILDELVRPGARFHRRIANIHPGITADDSPFQRRGAYATLDALHGGRGERVDWASGATSAIEPVTMTGASFHYVDNGIDSGEVICDVLDTPIAPDDTILELRWNNFERSLFPALERGLEILADRHDAGAL